MIGEAAGRRPNREYVGAAAGYSGQTASDPPGTAPGSGSMLPHRISVYRRPAFWTLMLHYVRREYIVAPPDLPGTAIHSTLFHPTYAPGLQGWPDTLPYNYFWQWARHTNFATWAMARKMQATAPTGGTLSRVWAPVAQVPQGVGQGVAWTVPLPSYVGKLLGAGARGAR